MLKQLEGLARQCAALGTKAVMRGIPAKLQIFLVERVAKELGVNVEEIDPLRSLESHRLDSARVLALPIQLAQRLSLPIRPTLVGNYPTIEKLAAKLHPLTAADTVDSNV